MLTFVMHEETIMEYTDGTVKSNIISIQSLQEEIEELKKQSMYRPGDVVTMDKIIVDGYITAGTEQAKFYIPMAKPIAPECKTVTVTGSFLFRQNGNYIKDFNTTYGFNTDNGTDKVEYFSDIGIILVVCMAGGVSFPNMTNNDCVSADLTNLKIAFK